MENNDENNDSSVVKSKSTADFCCGSSDSKTESMPEKQASHNNHDKHDIHGECEKNNFGSNTDGKNIGNNNNFGIDDCNTDDIGCVHYKRRAKFVVSNLYIYSNSIDTRSYFISTSKYQFIKI